tara:strand:+ start:46655 stop:48049 length:1395 start_codon:yes stop_codon:yes gene_type:complete
MFDDESQEFDDGNLNEDLAKFDAFINGESIGFIDSDRWEALIDHFLMNGHFKNAAICCEEALTQFSFNSLFNLRLAQSYSALGRLKDAINIISEIEKQGESSFEIVLTKASIFSQLKDSKNAIRFFKEGLSLAEKEDKDEVYLDLAVEYENIGDHKSAIKVLKEAIRVNPNNESAIYEIAFCYDHLGDHESSIKCYSDFIDENPYSFTSWYNLGNAYSKLNKFEKAIWAYDYCILINDDFGPVYFNVANAFLALNKYTKAIENFHKCIELDGDDPIAFCYIGECHEQLDELELAKHFYNKSLELAPMLPDAWLGLGIVKDLEGNTREGLALIQKAVELDPDNAGIYHVLAGAHEKLGELGEAIDFYELSLAMDPSDEECLTNYIALLSESSLVEAFDFLNTFVVGENKIIPILRVSLLWKMGDKVASLNLFAVCIENDRKKATELFEIYPEFKNLQEFADLSEE